MKVIKTNDGYMVEQDNGDYLCDANGDNLWDTRAWAETVIATAQDKTKNETQTWKEFNRMSCTDNFYGCVAPDGLWFDSGMTYTTAVTHCCYREGQFDLSIEGEALWMNDAGAKLGYSIIHSSMIEQMYEKGLIK